MPEPRFTILHINTFSPSQNSSQDCSVAAEGKAAGKGCFVRNINSVECLWSSCDQQGRATESRRMTGNQWGKVAQAQNSGLYPDGDVYGSGL